MPIGGWETERKERHDLKQTRLHKGTDSRMVSLECRNCNLSFRGDGKTKKEAIKDAKRAASGSPCFFSKHTYY